MRDIYMQAKNIVSEVAIPATGSEIDNARKSIVGHIQVAYIHCDQLMELGCINAHIHFKSDRKTMFMNKPSDESGNRAYIHVGVDPEKQKEAYAKVAREAKRKRISEAAERIADDARELDRQLDNLLWRYQRLIQDAEKLHQVINEPSEPETAKEQASYER